MRKIKECQCSKKRYIRICKLQKGVPKVVEEPCLFVFLFFCLLVKIYILLCLPCFFTLWGQVYIHKQNKVSRWVKTGNRRQQNQTNKACFGGEEGSGGLLVV